MGTGALETLKHGTTLPCLALAWLLAPMGALVWQHFSPVPYHPCGVAVVLREWRSGSEGHDHPPVLLCLTWDKPCAASLVILAAVGTNLDPWLDLGFQADF